MHSRLPEGVRAETETPHPLERELHSRILADVNVLDRFHETCLDGLWFWSLEDPSEHWMSASAWKRLGYEAALNHRPVGWEELIHPEDRDVVAREIDRHAADPARPFDATVRLLHRCGAAVRVRCRGTILRDEAGRPVRMLGSHTDVGDAPETGTALVEHARALEESNFELRQFAGTASHDLKAPLRAIAGYVRALEHRLDGRIDDETRALITRAAAGADAMGELVDEILEYSCLESHANPFGPVDLGAVARQVRTFLLTSIEQAGATVELEELPVVHGDRLQLAQVLRNLVENAIKYRGDSPSVVVVGSDERESEWVVRVTDNGIGIAPEHRRTVFEAFRRLHTAAEYPGAGVGLAVCHRIVGRHGGSIWVESSPGGGSTFFFTLNK